MIPYKILYHHNIPDDMGKLNHEPRRRVISVIENKISIYPDKYGTPLRKPLAGYWKLRVGTYRIVYKIKQNEIWILAIMHRKDIYRYIVKNRL